MASILSAFIFLTMSPCSLTDIRRLRRMSSIDWVAIFGVENDRFLVKFSVLRKIFELFEDGLSKNNEFFFNFLSSYNFVEKLITYLNNLSQGSYFLINK